MTLVHASALHPDVHALMQASTAPPLGTLAPVEMRVSYAASRRALQPDPDQVAAIEDLAIAGPGVRLRLRLYRGAVDDKPLPCLLFLHGGGWVLGDLDTHDGICRRIAACTGSCVLAVDYRLAPEHKFPAALEDGATALRWLANEAGRLGIDPDRLAIGGDSAGGNLAAVLALMGRDGGLPRSMYQVLFYPVTDLRMESESYRHAIADLPLTAAAMRYFADHYLPDVADRLDWRASPRLAPSLAGTPPALVLTCGHDPLADEGRAYAERLEKEGVAVTALHLSDQAHGILNLGRAIGAATGVIDFAAAVLKDAWRERPEA
ncbi:MAG: alpha/beta hydrolase [Rhodopila sp.]|jgi:acetyl esterase